MTHQEIQLPAVDQDQVAEQYRTSTNLNARIALHAQFSINPYPWMRWLFDHLDLPATCRVLELGCGPANLWQENRDRIPEGWALTLTDFSGGMAAEARRRLDGAPQIQALLSADAQAIPFCNAAFDAVIANHMLYHVPDLPAALCEIGRVLRPGGRLFASTVGETHMRELWDLVAPFVPHVMDAVTATSRGFTLENGAVQLANVFTHVDRYLYDDALAVDEAEPLIAYVLSSNTLMQTPLSETLQAAFRKQVVEHLKTKGVIRITKASGLFVAHLG
ncbi:MAG: class I SAM-dependent methyltransferase [Anaerolineae bacterium]|nr:class I SAM-dependent methyltransferase [Anaerolineae bacterium]